MRWNRLGPEEMKPLLASGRRVHCVGAGGVSMCALCEVLHQRGLRVSGSDRVDGEALARLREKGILVYGNEDAAHVAGADAVIRTAAAGEDNPEIAAARSAGIPVLERGDAWGQIMRECETALCLAGTHGKTTTTGMLAHIALAAGADPTIMLGGILPVLNAGYRAGRSGLMIAEADEYCNSFHRFAPTTAVLLNIEADHLDFFADLEAVIASFRTFCRLLPPNGHIAANIGDENVRKAVEGLPNITWFGEGGTVCAEHVTQLRGRCRFTLRIDGKARGEVALSVPGLHNLQNALGAAAAGWLAGFPDEALIEGLQAFRGTGRRMEYIGRVQGKDAELYDDYAHHPTEVAVTLRAASAMGCKRVLCVFQPHTYTRVKALLGDLADALRLCERVFITDIYAARENDPGDIHARDLCALVKGSTYCESLKAAAEAVLKETRDGDMVVVMGAGDVLGVTRMIRAADSRVV